MNDLRFQLEDIQHDLEQETKYETYRMQKYESLLKPWTTFQSIKQKQTDDDEAICQPAVVDNLENKIAEVDNVLRKAKLIREGKGDSKIESLSSKTAKGSKPTLNGPTQGGKQLTITERRKTYSAKLKSRKTSTGQKNKLANKATSVPGKTSQEVSTLTKSEITSIPCEKTTEVFPKQTETSTLTLQEVVQADKSLTKFLKLKSMHSKIKTKQDINSISLPITEELSFINSLYNIKSVMDRNHPVIASDAAQRQLKETRRKCNNLNQLLAFKNLCCHSVDVGLLVYRDRLLYRHANQMFDKFSMLRNIVCNTRVIVTKSDKHHGQLIQELQGSCLPITLGFDKYLNMKALTKARTKLTGLKLEIKLKTILHENFTANITEIGSNTEFVTYLKIAYAILAQSRQCTNPAVVWDD